MERGCIYSQRRTGKDVHLGRLFGIMVEKGSELNEDDPLRKYKYSVVFQGNRVIDQDWQAAIFQDLGSSPAGMEASKATDAYGCFPGHDIEQADATQAYVQAFLEGKETWVEMPQEVSTTTMLTSTCFILRPENLCSPGHV